MEQKQNANQLEDEVRAYNILLRRHINDDRLMGERNSIFLASSSILFLGFAMLPQTAQILRIAIPILGLFCVFLLFVLLGVPEEAWIFGRNKRKDWRKKVKVLLT